MPATYKFLSMSRQTLNLKKEIMPTIVTSTSVYTVFLIIFNIFSTNLPTPYILEFGYDVNTHFAIYGNLQEVPNFNIYENNY